MKNFDEVRLERAALERSFQIGGETFSYRSSVLPEDLLPYFKMRTKEPGEPLTQEQQIAIYDDTVILYLADGEDKKWRKVRKEADPPISLSDIVDLIDWLFEEQASRPTGAPSDSSTGSGNGATTTNSRASSRSRAEKG